MKKFFGVLYALYGCAWVALASKIENATIALVVAGLGGLCFLAAALAFFASGWPWRVVQVIFGTTTLALWLLGAGYFAVYLFGWLHTVDMGALAPLLGGVVAFVLTIPAVAYLRSLAHWRRARATGAADRAPRMSSIALGEEPRR